jgi:hypothetical protein
MKEFVEALNKYRDGEIKLDELELIHEKSGKFPHFHHYINDSEKRGKDPAYSIMQEKALAQFIKLLRNNEFDAAEEVTFLE